MKEITRNRAFIKHLQYARHPSRCTFTLMSSFLSHKSQGSGYHFYLHLKDGKLSFRKVKYLAQGHAAINNG